MNQEEELIAVSAATQKMRDIAMSLFPDEPVKAITLLQTAFVTTAVGLFEPEGLLDTILESTEDMYLLITEGGKDV